MIIHPLRFYWCTKDNKVTFNVEQNPEHILHEKYYSRGKIPPLSERVKYLRLAGKPESFIKRIIKFYMLEKKNSDKYQKQLDNIFLKFNIKPVKKRVLKSVKKLPPV